LHIIRNVFSLETIVIYLIYLRNPSFPRTQKQQLSPSLKNQHSFLERGGSVSERPHAHMVYIPTELFLALKGKCWSLKIGESAAILDCINESLYREGFIDEETYQRFKERYRKPLLEIVREREKSSVKVEVKSAKLEVQKTTVVKETVDYSKLSDDELLEAYRKAIIRNDVVEPNLIQGEARRRGYLLIVDGFGNIQKINIKGEKQACSV